MTIDEYRTAIRVERIKAGMNSRYHQAMESRYSQRDRAIRMLVGLLSILGLFFAFRDYPPLGILVAFISFVAAVILNIVPFSHRAKEHSSLFQLWSRHYTNILNEERKPTYPANIKESTNSMIEKLLEFRNISCELDPIALQPDPQLLKRYQEEEKLNTTKVASDDDDPVEKKSTLLDPDADEPKR
jgi:hypothetical protein